MKIQSVLYMKLLMLLGNPLLPSWDAMLLCCCSPWLCAFSSISPFVCVFVCCTLSHQPRDQSAAHNLDSGSFCPRCIDNDGQNREGEERKIKNPCRHFLNKHSVTDASTQKGHQEEFFLILPVCCLHWLVFYCERRQCSESHTAHQTEAVVDIREWVTKGASLCWCHFDEWTHTKWKSWKWKGISCFCNLTTFHL